MMITLDAIEIQKIIPHRYPMLLVDRILELEPMKRAVGVKNITTVSYTHLDVYKRQDCC